MISPAWCDKLSSSHLIAVFGLFDKDKDEQVVSCYEANLTLLSCLH